MKSMTGETIYLGDRVACIGYTGFVQVGKVIELLHDRDCVKVFVDTTAEHYKAARPAAGTAVAPSRHILVLK